MCKTPWIKLIIALTSLKCFCEEALEYFVAASGGLLGIALHQGTSFPVGKVDNLELEPLSFEEFADFPR